MRPRLYVVDDDYGIRTILSNIIEDYDLGEHVGESSDGALALEEILELKPDVAFIDLLLPNMDGIEIIKNVKSNGSETQFIMISEVSSQDMISEAYKTGIEFYINKPINVIEVVSVTRKAIENQKNMRVLKQIGKTLSNSKSFDDLPTTTPALDTKNSAIKVFSELGIMGESGCKDLINLIQIIVKDRVQTGHAFQKYNMSELYEQLSQLYEQEGVKTSITVKAIEQRIRRTIQAALQNIANIGIEDFGNYKFERYSTSIFEFREVKSEMDYIRGKSKYRGKINAKTFIEGVVNQLNI